MLANSVRKRYGCRLSRSHWHISVSLKWRLFPRSLAALPLAGLPIGQSLFSGLFSSIGLSPHSSLSLPQDRSDTLMTNLTLRAARETESVEIKDLIYSVGINPMGLDWK